MSGCEGYSKPVWFLVRRISGLSFLHCRSYGGSCNTSVICLFAMEAKPRMSKKRRVFTSLFILALGFLPLINSLDNPRLAGLHVPDFLRLIAVGFCAGVAFGLFMGGRESAE